MLYIAYYNLLAKNAFLLVHLLTLLTSHRLLNTQGRITPQYLDNYDLLQVMDFKPDPPTIGFLSKVKLNLIQNTFSILFMGKTIEKIETDIFLGHDSIIKYQISLCLTKTISDVLKKQGMSLENKFIDLTHVKESPNKHKQSFRKKPTLINDPNMKKSKEVRLIQKVVTTSMRHV